ncbi:MAG: alpha/beta fold hydrolase [Gemmatimonadota bacterium]|nr:alpha/beta fold hydrolase [Gemmatimonadota bacterium]
MESWIPRLLWLARIGLLSALGFSLFVFLVQRWLAYPGVFRQAPRREATAPRGVEQRWLALPSGSVEAWLFPAEGPGPRPAVIFAHGNGELIDDWRGEMSDLANHGLVVLAVEFPGYGFSQGKPSRATIQETFSAAFDSLRADGRVDPDRIVAYGRSMGGGAAGDLALNRPVAALVLQSTFSSAMAVARSMLVPGLLVRDRFDNLAAVRRYDGPVLLMHGLRDDVVPFAHAEAIAAARAGLQITRIDCAHNDCAGAWPEIRGHLLAFLEREGVVEPRPLSAPDV